MNNNFSLLGLINTASKTLNIANQMLPLYKQVKPLMEKSTKVFSNINTFKSNVNSTLESKFTKNSEEPKEQINSPTFFQ